MADTVTGPTILQQNEKRVTIKIVVQSDGTGSTTVFGDVSALDANNQGTAVSTLSLQRVWWSCANGDGGDAFARLDYEDSDGDIPIITLIDSGYWDFREFGGIPANTSSNSNENLLDESKIGDAELNLNKMTIKLKNKIDKINTSEKNVLIKMISSPGKIFSRSEIGKISKISKERSIDVMITRLRKKIEINPKNPKFLQTIRGSGYVLWIK